MKQPVRWYDVFSINIYWFALTARSQTISPLILPLLVQQFVGVSAQGAALGTVRLWALMVTVLAQSFMGMVSDRSTLPWGRRRPFILAGSLAEIILFALIGLTAGMDGSSGYPFLFGLYLLSMVSSNTVHAAYQRLLPDLVPAEKQGLYARVKALLELPLPLIFVAFVIGQLLSRGNLWGGLILLMLVIAACMIFAMTIREKRLEGPATRPDWQPFVRLATMAGGFALVILVVGGLVRRFLRIEMGLPDHTEMIVTAIVGLLAMAAATALGVSATLRIGIHRKFHYPPAFKWWVANRLAFLIGSTNVATFLVFFLQERFADYAGMKAAGPAAIMAMIVGILILLTALPGNWLAGKLGKRPLIAFAGLLAATGVMVLLVSKSLAAVYLAGGFIGAGTGLFYPADWSLGSEIIPHEQIGRFLSLANLAGAGAGAVGAYIAGPIADQFGYALIMGIYGALFLLSIPIVLGMGKARSQ